MFECEHAIGRWLRDSALAGGDRIAIDDRGVLVTYATLWSRAEALSKSLGEAGYGAGARIVTVSGNSVDQVVVFFACALSGVTFIPLSWRLTAAELSELIRRSRPDLVLVEDDYAALGLEALQLHATSVAGSANFARETGSADATNADAASSPAPDGALPQVAALGCAGIEQQVPRARIVRPVRPAQSDDPLLVIYTSGSEAAPKGVVLTHASCFWNNLALNRAMPLNRDDVVLAMLPQHHVAAWNVQPLLAWWVGATVVLERSFQPDRIVQLVRDRGVTAMMGVPTQYRLLLDVADPGPADLASLRYAVVGGATIPPELASDWAELGVPLAQGYGLTEAAPNVLYLRPEELAKCPGAVGRPYPTVDVCIVDPATDLPLEGPATGELWVRGPSLFAGYLDDEAATARAMRDGWLRTGDLVSRDEDGTFRVVDRIKNIYVSGGENVAPAEVELALSAHPVVEEVAVVGVPDDVWGERGYAYVVAREPLSADELMRFAKDRLAGFKLPAHIEFVDELPRSTIEKIARHKLRELARQRLSETRQSSREEQANA